MKHFVILSLLLTLISSLDAQIIISEPEQDLNCKLDASQQLSFKLGTNLESTRIWYLESGDDVAIELTLSEVNYFDNCSDCLAFSGIIFPDLLIRGELSSLQLTYQTYGPGRENAWSEWRQSFTCTPTSF